MRSSWFALSRTSTSDSFIPASPQLRRRGNRADLLHQTEHVGNRPRLAALAARDALEGDPEERDRLPARRQPHEGARVRPGRAYERRDAVALGDEVHDLVARVRERLPERGE